MHFQYSLKYFDREICLIDKYPIIVDIWHFLQDASENDILNLPKIVKGQKVSDFNLSDIESKFMGFLVQASVGQPRNSVGSLKGINVERDLKRIFPKRTWSKLHLQIIFYGREYCKARECYGLTCKICSTCYPNRKKPFITKKA